MIWTRRIAVLAWCAASAAATSVLQQTLYSFKDDKAYVRLKNNDLISLDFNQEFSTESGLTSSTDSSGYVEYDSAPVNATLSLVGEKLFAFYNDDDGNIAVSTLNGTSWVELDVVNEFVFYNYSTYLATSDNDEKIYIYGGISLTNESDTTDRLLEFDALSYTLNDNVSSSVTPTNFYGASNLLINYNTQLVIGGKSSSGWVSLKQLALWQYESWSFKTVSMDSDINSRKFAQALPIFTNADTEELESGGASSGSSLSIEGAILIGGELIDDYSTPKIIKLNATSSSGGWNWSSLDDDLEEIDLDTMLGSCMIYETLVVFNGTSSSGTSSQKRSGSGGSAGYTIQLFDVSENVVTVDSVDYSSVGSAPASGSSKNKTTAIAVGVVVPIVVLIAIGLAVFFYMRHKKNKDVTNNFENFDIVDFYNNLSKKSSVSYGHEEVKVNNYDDNDNLSINSWRRKREEFDRAWNHGGSGGNGGRKVAPATVGRPLPQLPEQIPPQRSESLIKRSLSNFSKTFSLRNVAKKQSMASIMEERRPYLDSASLSEYSNEKSRSTLQFIDEDLAMKQHANDSRSILSATTYYEDAVDVAPAVAPATAGAGAAAATAAAATTAAVPRTARTPMVHQRNPTDDDMNDIDVQVLVSSKRRSKLRVMNPDVVVQDADGDFDRKSLYIDENEAYMNELFEVIESDAGSGTGQRAASDGDGTRKRVVSGDK